MRHPRSVLLGIDLQTLVGARQLRSQSGMAKTIHLIRAAVLGSFLMPLASTSHAPCAGSSPLSASWSFWITVCYNQELIASEDVIVRSETQRKSLDHDSTTRPR